MFAGVLPHLTARFGVSFDLRPGYVLVCRMTSVSAISRKNTDMSKEDRTRAGRTLVDRVLRTEVNLKIVDSFAAPDMLLQYCLHEPRRGHEDIKAFRLVSVRPSLTSTSEARRNSLPKVTMWLAGGKAPQNALHRNHRSPYYRRQDRRQDRS
jgi:hypothetical protein